MSLTAFLAELAKRDAEAAVRDAEAVAREAEIARQAKLIATLTDQLATMNERLAELMAALERKTRKPAVPKVVTPVTLTDAQREAFENRPLPP